MTMEHQTPVFWGNCWKCGRTLRFTSIILDARHFHPECAPTFHDTNPAPHAAAPGPGPFVTTTISPGEPVAELVQRLRALAVMDEVGSDNPLGRDAADALERLAARAEAAEADNARLREALKPFAEASQRFDAASDHFGAPPAKDWTQPRTEFTHGQLRAARAALEQTP